MAITLVTRPMRAVGNLNGGANGTLLLEISTDMNPGRNKKFNEGHQEYTEEGVHELNSGAVVKFFDVDRTGFQLSAHTAPLSVLAQEGALLTETAVLTLENKDSSWNIIPDDTWGMLGFNPTGPTFDFVFYGNGLAASTGYSLIYYADPWPGDNPGALIGTGTSDGDGNITMSGSKDFGYNLPHDDDENTAGAKIWLIPSSVYNSGTNSVTAWPPTYDWLFEHHLISYSDTNIP